jgi:hypothetical protein
MAKKKKATAPKPAAKPAIAAKKNGRTAGVSLDDIRAVKGLVGRVGAAHLKNLVEIMGQKMFRD